MWLVPWLLASALVCAIFATSPLVNVDEPFLAFGVERRFKLAFAFCSIAAAFAAGLLL